MARRAPAQPLGSLCDHISAMRRASSLSKLDNFEKPCIRRIEPEPCKLSQPSEKLESSLQQSGRKRFVWPAGHWPTALQPPCKNDAVPRSSFKRGKGRWNLRLSPQLAPISITAAMQYHATVEAIRKKLHPQWGPSGRNGTPSGGRSGRTCTPSGDDQEKTAPPVGAIRKEENAPQMGTIMKKLYTHWGR